MRPRRPIEPDAEFRAVAPAPRARRRGPARAHDQFDHDHFDDERSRHVHRHRHHHGGRTFQRPGLHSLTPYIMVDDARRAIEWYGSVLDATLDGEAVVMDDGRIGHAELRIGDATLMLADEFPEMGLIGPTARGGASVSLAVYVPDADATFARAVEAGATVEREVADQFHGSRSGTLLDPFGHRWMIMTWIGSAEGGDDTTRTSSTQATDLWNEVGYYVLGISDIDRGMTFFGGLFGWRFAEPGQSPDGERSVHVESSTVPFGLSEGDRPFVSPYFRVADLDAAAARVLELGGEVLEVQQSASGDSATCIDDQGTRFELWQPRDGY